MAGNYRLSKVDKKLRGSYSRGGKKYVEMKINTTSALRAVFKTRVRAYITMKMLKPQRMKPITFIVF
jgi:hypothetical protein